MKILVTGANGYIEMGVVKQLLTDGIDVIATDITDNFYADCTYCKEDIF